MAAVASWQHLFAMCPHSTPTAPTGSATFNATDITFDTGDHLIGLTNRPSIDPNVTPYDVRKAVGIPERRAGNGFEFNKGINEPLVAPEADVSINELAFLFGSLFQKGALQNLTTEQIKRFLPYADANPSRYFSFLKFNEDFPFSDPSNTSYPDSDVNQLLDGCIVRSMTLTLEVNGALHVACEVQGITFDPAKGELTVPIKGDGWHFVNLNPLLFADCHIGIGGFASANLANLQAVTITLNNNVFGNFYDSATLGRLVMGEFTVEGSVTLPYDWGPIADVAENHTIKTEIAKILNAIPTEVTNLYIWWGDAGYKADATVVGECMIQIPLRWQNATEQEEDEVLYELPFVGVANGGADVIPTNHAFKCSLYESGAADRSWSTYT